MCGIGTDLAEPCDGGVARKSDRRSHGVRERSGVFWEGKYRESILRAIGDASRCSKQVQQVHLYGKGGVDDFGEVV